MAEQAHFVYAGNAKLKDNEIEVKEVKFLVPITVKYTQNKTEFIVFGQIDYTNKEVYFDTDQKSAEELKKKTLLFLNQITNAIPQDKYAAPEEMLLKAEKIRVKQEEIQDNQTGDVDE